MYLGNTQLLESNIKGLFKGKGQVWLNELPVIIRELCNKWNLTDIRPVPNMTFNYVFFAQMKLTQPVCVKISYDEKLIKDEKNALEYFAGNGCVRILEYDNQYHALILEQAMPGITLKEYRKSNLDLAMDYYIDVMQHLHNRPFPEHSSFPEIKKWPKVFDRVDKSKMPEGLLDEAKSLAQDFSCQSDQ